MIAPIFLLAPGRSFTTVFSVMLGQHPELFGIPETNLSMAPTIGAWLSETGGVKRPYLRAGLLRTIAHLETGEQTTQTVRQAQQWLNAHMGMTTAELFAMLRNSVPERGLVEKSPITVTEPQYLRHLLELAPDARFIHMTRHPYSNCQSMIKTEWYRMGLERESPESYDHRFNPPVFDPQFHWLGAHQRILEFQQLVSPDRWLHVRGEDVLSTPDTSLPEICRWLGIDDGAAALAAMKLPEKSPFARLGPQMAVGGNDPNFLNDPLLRPFKAPKSPLLGPLPWRSDGTEFTAEVRTVADQFGYTHDLPELKPAKPQSTPRELVRIEPDGDGSPMPHSNMLDNSVCGTPPLRSVSSIDHIPFPAYGGINFGAYTGEKYAVAVYEGPREPAIVAYDLTTGNRLWQTALDIFPQSKDMPLRWVGGVLLAKLHFDDGTVEHCTFAGNRKEFICFNADGKIRWRKSAAEILGSEDLRLGTPRCLRIARDKKIVLFTSQGNLIKFDPLTGEIEDLYTLDDRAMMNGRLLSGRFKVSQSVVLIGDVLYAQGAFEPQPEQEDLSHSPVCLFRLQISGTEDGRFRRLEAADDQGRASDRYPVSVVGNKLQGGSPSGMFRTDGTPVIFANGHRANGGFAVRAIADENGTLREQWSMRLPEYGDTTITAAPSNDPETGLYMCNTKTHMYVVRDAANRDGTIEPDEAIAARNLLAAEFKDQAVAAEISSPVALCRDPGETGFVCYVGLSVRTTQSADPYSVLSAVKIDVDADEITAVPLWSGSLAQDSDGNPIPSPRSFAQPAMFQYPGPDGDRTGIIMGTIQNGVSIFR